MSAENPDFLFFPRPEAKPMHWDDLVPPVRSAVRTLLVLLDGAERQSGNADLEVASCFLVNGERGTGKTSVLLNAKEAFLKQEEFFGQPEGNPIPDRATDKDKKEKYDAIKSAGHLKTRVKWLEILDLEPVQAETNLITAVLTRIRDAYPSSAQDGELTSIFEAGEDSAKPQFDQLIGDATLMWEDIKEQDTRGNANRQVAVASLYSNFRSRFKKAMDSFAKELGRQAGHQDPLSIILPIDNIDRSTEHLHNIVKLAQLVSHPRLWLVMAGGREDIETFLERAYRKELIRNAGGSEALGRAESSGEDETLAMARRQAAATAQKIWPSSHRITIGLMKPEDTLGFFPPGRERLGTIGSLFCQVQIRTWLKQNPDNNQPVCIPMIDCFIHPPFPFRECDVTDSKSLLKKLKEEMPGWIPTSVRIPMANGQEDAETATMEDGQGSLVLPQVLAELNKLVKAIPPNVATQKREGRNSRLLPANYPYPYRYLFEDTYPGHFTPSIPQLTQAAKNGLKLPARSVLELWQLAYWAVNDKTFFHGDDSVDFRAEQIIRTMLRNAVSESKISSRLSRCLQDNVIRNDVNGGTQLNFKEVQLQVECVASIDTEVALPIFPKRAKSNIQSRIHVKRGEESFLRFKLKLNDKDGKNCEEELPALVAAWLSILYDILALAERLAVLEGVAIQPPAMGTRHMVVVHKQDGSKRLVTKELRWPVPEWETFWAHDLFWQRWNSFQATLEREREKIESANSLQVKPESKQEEEEGEEATKLLLPRFLAAGWIQCALDTSRALKPPEPTPAGKPQSPGTAAAYGKSAGNPQVFPSKFKWPLDELGMEALELDILRQAAGLYCSMETCIRSPLKLRKHFDGPAMRKWLVKCLPMFFSYWYVPVGEPDGSPSRFEDIKGKLAKQAENDPEKPCCICKLLETWENNADFIVATMDEKLVKLFEPEAGATDQDQKILEQEREEFFKALGELCELHRSRGVRGSPRRSRRASAGRRTLSLPPR